MDPGPSLADVTPGSLNAMGRVSYCLMPNHWHLVVGPNINDILPRFVGWLTLTHTQRWHAYRKTTGGGVRTAVRCGLSR